MSESKFYIKAQESIAKQEYDKAVDLLTKAINQEPNNANYYSHRGVSRFHLGLQKEAIADMNKSVELEPDYSYRYASRAYIRSTVGDVKGAIADYEKAIELDPEDSVSLNNLGMMQEKMGYDNKAKENFERADHLAELLDENGIDYKEEIKPRNIQKEINEEKKEQTSSKLLLDIFRKKEVRREFFQFIKNGFKSNK